MFLCDVVLQNDVDSEAIPHATGARSAYRKDLRRWRLHYIWKPALTCIRPYNNYNIKAGRVMVDSDSDADIPNAEPPPPPVASKQPLDPSKLTRFSIAAEASTIFRANKPPTKRRAPPAPTSKKRSKAAATAAATTSSAAPAAMATIRTQEKLAPSELLDDRDVADPDEQYTDNERALTQFMRLHPMLSLDATSERMLNTVAKMVDDYSVPTRELEVVTKTFDDQFLAPPNTEIGERECVNAKKCVCRWLAIFRFGENTKNAFVCKEFLRPSQHAEFMKTGELPKTPAKCLICSRYFTSYIYTLARANPSFCPTKSIELQAFANTIAVDSPVDDVVTHASSVGTNDGYRASKMLFADEKWADSASSRNDLGTLLWRPVVRFNASDYEFKTDVDGKPLIVQRNMGSVEQDFFLPSLREVSATAASFCRPPTTDRRARS